MEMQFHSSLALHDGHMLPISLGYKGRLPEACHWSLGTADVAGCRMHLLDHQCHCQHTAHSEAAEEHKEVGLLWPSALHVCVRCDW